MARYSTSIQVMWKLKLKILTLSWNSTLYKEEPKCWNKWLSKDQRVNKMSAFGSISDILQLLWIQLTMVGLKLSANWFVLCYNTHLRPCTSRCNVYTYLHANRNDMWSINNAWFTIDLYQWEFQTDHCSIYSSRFVVKPEEGVSNVFLMYIWLNQWEGVNTNLGVERHQRGGGLNPSTPQQIERCLYIVNPFHNMNDNNYYQVWTVTNPKPCYLHLAHRQPRSIQRQPSTSQVRLWNYPPTSGALVFTWTVNSIWIGMWIQYAVHATTTSGLWGTFDLPWTRRPPPTSEEALSAHASITVIRWCTGSPRMKKLQRVQNALIRVIFSLGSRDSVSGARRDLHWLPIEQRIIFKIAVLTFNCRRRSTPPYLCDLVHDYLPRRTLRSGDGVTLEVPRTKTVTAERAFSVAAPTIWTPFLSNWDNLNISVDLKLNLKLIFSLRHLAFWIFLDF